MAERETSRTIRNPVLPGFHPDPSILRVGTDYYLATSTFEWYPGVRLHHSKDLVNWTAIGGVLDRPRLLDLTGAPDSGGVWAPNLSYADGSFHLVFSNVSAYAGGFSDCFNYVVTATEIDGPWSEPTLLHARGFDASLFHEGEQSWLLNLVHDWRPGHGGSAGLEAQRYDRAARRLVAAPIPIELPPSSTWIEGPNLYRIGDWYYLVTADGGTGWEHQVTVSRSRHLTGPYETDPTGPLVTAKNHPEWPLQKAGHGSLVETPDGEWYLAYLVARPHGVYGPCILGRETALSPVHWSEGWPRIPGGLPALEVPAPALPPATSDPFPAVRRPHDGSANQDTDDDFDEPVLGPHWSTLRRPAAPDWLSLTERRSHLRLRGGRSPESLLEPSLVARRVTAAHSSFEARIDFRPQRFQQLAGITAYYNTRNWHFLYVTSDRGTTVVRVATRDHGRLTVHTDSVELQHAEGLHLRVEITGADLTFNVDDGAGRRVLGPTLDATILSDEHATEFDDDQIRAMGFTGAFVGLWVWDLSGAGHHADFDLARYRALA